MAGLTATLIDIAALPPIHLVILPFQLSCTCPKFSGFSTHYQRVLKIRAWPTKKLYAYT